MHKVIKSGIYPLYIAVFALLLTSEVIKMILYPEKLFKILSYMISDIWVFGVTEYYLNSKLLSSRLAIMVQLLSFVLYSSFLFYFDFKIEIIFFVLISITVGDLIDYELKIYNNKNTKSKTIHRFVYYSISAILCSITMTIYNRMTNAKLFWYQKYSFDTIGFIFFGIGLYIFFIKKKIYGLVISCFACVSLWALYYLSIGYGLLNYVMTMYLCGIIYIFVSKNIGKIKKNE